MSYVQRYVPCILSRVGVAYPMQSFSGRHNISKKSEYIYDAPCIPVVVRLWLSPDAVISPPTRHLAMFELPYINEPDSNATSVSRLNRKTNTYKCFYSHALDT